MSYIINLIDRFKYSVIKSICTLHEKWYNMIERYEGFSMRDNAIFDKYDVARYVIEEYYKFSDGRLISPLKLQKGLYFLFAMWGGYIRSGKNAIDTEISVKNYREYLFEPLFLAWKYGPVDKEIYNKFKDITNLDEVSFGNLDNLRIDKCSADDEKAALDYIDGLLTRIFKTSDFALVDLSHKDNCWKIARNQDSSPEDNLMDNELIIKEYAERS